MGKEGLRAFSMLGLCSIILETGLKKNVVSLFVWWCCDILTPTCRFLQQYFQKDVPARFDSCPDVLFNAAYGVKYSAKRMKKWEKDYVALKTKEQEDQEEVRVRILFGFTSI